MLDNTDKKWITETVDGRLDERLAEQEERFNKVLDERFTNAIETFDRKIDERFHSFETRFMLVLENVVSSRL